MKKSNGIFKKKTSVKYKSKYWVNDYGGKRLKGNAL